MVLVQDSWRVRCLETGITAESGRGEESYAVLYRRFVENEYSDEFASFSKFGNTKSMMNVLERFGILKVFTTFHGEECNFSDQRCSTENVVSNLHKPLVILDSQVCKAKISMPTLQTIVMENSKFMVGGDRGTHVAVF